VKFLIVDDDPLCRELLRVVLAPYGRCDLAKEGNEALNLVESALQAGEPYDLVCLDIMMPGMDGHEVLRRMRQLEARHGWRGLDVSKVIMTTAIKDTGHCIQAFKEGCESYCTKPLTQEKILSEARALLGEEAFPATPSLGASSSAGSTGSAEQQTSTQQSHTPATGTQPAERSEAAPSKRLRCLVVDDDRVCRELLREMLEPFAECSFAYDGEEAVEAVRLALEDDLPYELICLDIMMPGIDGHQALERIRKAEKEHGRTGLDGAKVIMTTALRDSKHCVRSFREGCEAYVTKPVREEELLDKLRQLGVLGVPTRSVPTQSSAAQ